MKGLRAVLVVAGALTVLLAAGCAAAPDKHTSGKFPVVVVHPNVQSRGLSEVKLTRDEAMLLSPTRVAFMTTGSSSCVWWPVRLTALDASTIRIDMRVNGRIATCSGGAVPFPIAVKIDPRVVDVHRPLTVHVAFKVRLPNGGGINQFDRTAVAPALSS